MSGIKEEWRDVLGYEGIYQVSDAGRVRSLDRKYVDRIGRNQFYPGKIKSLISEKDGYKVFRVSVGGNQKLLKVHREVLKAFNSIPDMDKLMTNHINNIKNDNRLENLEWVTAKGNSRHYHNKTSKGRYNRSINLSDGDVMSVVSDFLDGATKKDISIKYKVSQSCIADIITRRTNRYIIEENFDVKKIDIEIRLRKYKKSMRIKKEMNKFFLENKNWIIEYFKYGFSREYVSRVYKIPEHWVRFMFGELKKDIVLHSKRVERVNRTRNLGIIVMNYCKKNNISRGQFIEESVNDFPLELIERQLIVGKNNDS